MKDSIRTVIIGGLALLTVAFAAAILESTMVTDGGTPGTGDGRDGDEPGPLPRPAPDAAPGEFIQIPYVSEIVTIIAAIFVLILLVYMLQEWRDSAVLLAVLGGLVGLILLIIRLLPEPTTPTDAELMEVGNATPIGGNGDNGAGGAIGHSPPSVVLLLVIGIALLGAVLVMYRATSRGTATLEGADDEERSDAAAVAAAAGRAADRIEHDADLDNAVYRCWLEMTDLLDVEHPDACTPGEFADAAVAAGLGETDVDELTRLFEDVRYGTTHPTDEHERRAIAVFRRIQARYTEDEP